MKRHRGTLNAFYCVKKADLKGTYWVIPITWRSEKATLWRQEKVGGFQGVGGEEETKRGAQKTFSMVELFCNMIMPDTCHYTFAQTHKTCSTRSQPWGGLGVMTRPCRSRGRDNRNQAPLWDAGSGGGQCVCGDWGCGGTLYLLLKITLNLQLLKIKWILVSIISSISNDSYNNQRKWRVQSTWCESYRWSKRLLAALSPSLVHVHLMRTKRSGHCRNHVTFAQK